ncbi:TPA: helix-turn-helix domain-containing protein [Aeromonas salmonicida subsp. smithia]|jgi:putative transcriptional regulator|nr:helix-turn-helix transcriptional regulator [Aeromonas salmonicida]MDF8328302.1 helix-turn-helix transcriptional regulator [Aeromonas salmonicida]MDQ1883635.1 helix-turn-helix transcriptional regulator [Aeromonas salmonicida]MDQ1884310.1 helix-turn-helix transcriptional regulator [Aeromonas salmonicida]ORJ10755.1 transcriptional regulator [Aeromonas salmonicida]WCH28754.1 helix-turn-helix domain-containing protein [Aeromonas salmonicida]
MTMPNTEMPSMTVLNDGTRQRLRQLRESLGLSRPKFAQQLDIPPTTLKNYELGYREIGGGLLLRIINTPGLSDYAVWLMKGSLIIPEQVRPTQPH